MDPNLQRCILMFDCDINYKYKGQLFHSIGRFYIIVKFQLPKLNDMSIIFRKMQVNCENCVYLHPHISTKHAHLWGYVRNGHAQLICDKVMLLSRKLDGQYKHCNKTIN